MANDSIAPDGDLVLIVGQEKKEIRVQSAVLKVMSKPFSAMLDRHWKEGLNLLEPENSIKSTGLALPDDSAEAMAVLCAVIHGRPDLVDVCVRGSEWSIVDIAALADKYDLVNALTFQWKDWLRVEPRMNHLALAVAAYILRDEEHFKRLTGALVLKHDKSFRLLRSERVDAVLPMQIYCLLEEERTRAKLELLHGFLGEIYNPPGVCESKCGYTSANAFAYLNWLADAGLWPMSIGSLSEAMDIAMVKPDPHPDEASGVCTWGSKHYRPTYRAELGLKFGELRLNAGLSLDEVRKCEEEEYQEEESEESEDGEEEVEGELDSIL